MSTKNNSDSHHGIGFFTNITGYVLPPEAFMLITSDYSQAEVKVTLCLLMAAFEVGHEAQDLGFNDIVDLTGLAKTTVSRGLKEAKARGSVTLSEMGYKITLKRPSSEKLPMTCHESCLNIDLDDHERQSHETCHEYENATSTEKRHEIFNRLSEIGLATKVAHDLAYGDRYDIERIERQIDYYQFEVDNQLLPARLRNVPGYVVNRIKFDRQPPKEMTQGEKLWYNGDESDLVLR